MEQITFKRGSSFAINAKYSPSPTAPADLATVDIASEVRTPDLRLVAKLVVTKAPDGKSFMLHAPGGTATWPYNGLNCDIKLSYGGVVGYTRTVSINVQREVTA